MKTAIVSIVSLLMFAGTSQSAIISWWVEYRADFYASPSLEVDNWVVTGSLDVELDSSKRITNVNSFKIYPNVIRAEAPPPPELNYTYDFTVHPDLLLHPQDGQAWMWYFEYAPPNTDPNVRLDQYGFIWEVRGDYIFEITGPQDDWYSGPVIAYGLSVPESGPGVSILLVVLGFLIRARRRLA